MAHANYPCQKSKELLKSGLQYLSTKTLSWNLRNKRSHQTLFYIGSNPLSRLLVSLFQEAFHVKWILGRFRTDSTEPFIVLLAFTCDKLATSGTDLVVALPARIRQRRALSALDLESSSLSGSFPAYSFPSSSFTSSRVATFPTSSTSTSSSSPSSRMTTSTCFSTSSSAMNAPSSTKN